MSKQTRFYKVWAQMKQRCNNPKHPRFKDYGGRGITICKRWDLFSNFFIDMNESYKDNLTLDRINNSKGYSKNNCKWSTYREQNENRRDNKKLSFNGLTMTITRWSEKLGIKKSTLDMRFYKYGWNIEKCLTTPVRRHNFV